MVDWFLKFYVAEMAGAVDLSAHARSAVTVAIHSAHLVVIYSMGDRVAICVISEDVVDVGDGHGIDLTGTEDRECDTLDLV